MPEAEVNQGDLNGSYREVIVQVQLINLWLMLKVEATKSAVIYHGYELVDSY